MTAPEQPRCLCDGGFYEVKKHPFIVNDNCPIHGTKAQAEPQAMTLQEALRLAEDKHWAVSFTRDAWKGVYVNVTDDFGDELSNEGTWEKSFSEALGVPVVERDDTAELVEALAFARSVIKSGEPWTDTCEEVIGGALAKARKP